MSTKYSYDPSTEYSLAALLDQIKILVAKQTSNTARIIVSPVVTTTSVKILSANPDRKGLYLYNNSANSRYISFVSPANSSNNMTHIVATFATFIMPTPVWLGDIYAIGNAGTGTFLITELT